MSSSPAGAEPPLPWLFFLVAIVAAIAVGALLGYLGLTGHLGAGIPGSKAPAGGLTYIPLALATWNRKRRTGGGRVE